MRALFEKPHPHPNPSPAAQERGSSKQEQAYVHPQSPTPARPRLRTHPAPDALPAVLRDVPQRHPQHLDGGGGRLLARHQRPERSEEHTSEIQSLMRISYAVFCLNKNTTTTITQKNTHTNYDTYVQTHK